MEVILQTDTLSPVVSRPDISLRIRKFIREIETNPKFRGAGLERRVSARIIDPHVAVFGRGGLEFTMFQGITSYLSSSFRASFTIGNMTFCSVEQFYQYSRASFAEDYAIARAIHAAQTPLRARELGRRVKAHDTAKWDDLAISVAALGHYHKFMQNRRLKEALLATGESVIVFCDRTENRWGCGLPRDERASDVTRWSGQNILGKILTLLREHIRSDGCKMFTLG